MTRLYWLAFILLFSAILPTFGHASDLPREARQWLERAVLEKNERPLERKYTERYYRGILERLPGRLEPVRNDFAAYAEQLDRCEYLLQGFDLSELRSGPGILENETFRNSLATRLEGHIQTLAEPKPLPISEEFAHLPLERRQRLIRQILKNRSSAESVVNDTLAQKGFGPLTYNLTQIVNEIIGTPFSQVGDQLKGAPDSIWSNWSAGNTGVEIVTPIHQLLSIHKYFGSMKGRVVDFGSGYGFPAVVWSLLSPELEYVGFDMIEPKVQAANDIFARLGLSKARAFTQDLSDPKFSIPPAQYYYLFNPVNPEILQTLLDSLSSRRVEAPFYVITVGLISGWVKIPFNFIPEWSEPNTGIRIYRIYPLHSYK